MIAGRRPSIIDNIFTNVFEKNLNSGNLIDKITDHLPNFLFIADFNDQQKKQKIITRNMKGFNQETYLKHLDSLKSVNYINFAYVNELYNEFHSKLMAVIGKSAPYKTLSKQESKNKQKPWITKIIIKSIKTRNVYYNRNLHNRNFGTVDTIIIETYYRNYYRNYMR